MMEEFAYEDVLKATENFSPARLIGKGSHGSVYFAKLIVGNNKLFVAIKKPLQFHVHDHHDQVRRDNSKLENEIRVLSSLPENPHIIKFLGTSHDLARNYRILVMEFMPNGSLHNLLHVAEMPLSWPKRIEIVIQIAKAVRFLHHEVIVPAHHHQEPFSVIIHRDIKSENVLFDSDCVAKLADFGLAVLLSDHDEVDTQSGQVPAGTIGYLDPCYTTPSKLSTKNDVFSFGVLVLEIISGKKVMDVNRAKTNIVEWAVPLIRERRLDEVYDTRVPLRPDDEVEGTVRRMLYVAASCVSLEEDCRPSMADVVTEMEIMSSCFVDRVRLPIWTSFLRGFMLVRISRRKLAKRCRQIKCEAPIQADADHDNHDVCVSNGNKIMLRELFLADVATK